MKNLILIFVAFGSFHVAFANEIPGSKSAVCSPEHFANPGKEYAPYFFWFWDRPIDDPHTQQQIRDMAAEMLDNGFSPGYVHARFNMVGEADLPFEQWLSEDWFSAYSDVLEHVKKENAAMGFVNEYWWPSGRAAGRVLQNNPDLFAESLYWHTMDVAGGTTVHVDDAFFIVVAKRLTELGSLQSAIRSPEDQGSELGNGLLIAAGEHQSANYEMPIPHIPATISSESLQLISTSEPVVWTAPKNTDWRIYIFKKYFHPGCDGGRLNYLDSRLADEFLKQAHEPYFNNVGDFFGNTISGVFIDHEGDYGYKMAWSDDLARHYKKTNKRDIRLWMPLLIDQDIEGQYVKARWDWFEAVSDVYVQFFEQVNQWCVDRNLYAISNLWEESLLWQAGAVGDFFKAQRAFSMPGTDALGLRVLEPHDFIETKSVCEFEGRRLQSEIMGGAAYWGFDNIQIKKAANAATTWGVSHLVPHAVWLTRNLQGNPWLPDWFDQNPWWPQMHVWADFVRRASYVNACGHSAADVLLLNPMDSVWGFCGPDVFDPGFPGRVSGPAIRPLQTEGDVVQTPDEVKEQSAWWRPPTMEKWFSPEAVHINTIYSQALNDLVQFRIEFLVADRYYMRQMSVRDNLLVREPFEFKSIIMPAMKIIPRDVLAQIVKFAEKGGSVYVLGSWPIGSTDFGLYDEKIDKLVARLQASENVVFCDSSLVSELQKKPANLSAHFEFVTGQFDVLQQHRRIDGVDYFWLANNTGAIQDCLIRFPRNESYAGFQKWSCESGTISPADNYYSKDSVFVKQTFMPYEGLWLVQNNRPGAFCVVLEQNDRPDSSDAHFPQDDPLIMLSQIPWTARIDTTIQPPIKQSINIPDQFIKGTEVKLTDWSEWGLANFSGIVSYYGAFDVTAKIPTIKLDLGEVHAGVRVWMNGELMGDRLWPPYSFDCGGGLHIGSNTIRIDVSNLRNNSQGDHRPAGLLGPITLEPAR